MSYILGGEDGGSENGGKNNTRRWAMVGEYDVESENLMIFEDIVWATGERQTSVPEALLICLPGFQKASATNLCEELSGPPHVLPGPKSVPK